MTRLNQRGSVRVPRRKKFPKVKTRTIPVPEKCIVACLRPKDISDDDWQAFLNQAAHDVLANLKVSTIVVGVASWNEIRVLDEKELESVGFIHKDRIFLLKDDVDLSAYSQEEIEAIMTQFVSQDEEE